MKLNKKLLSILSCGMLVFSMVGCQPKEEELVEEPQPIEQEQDVDLVKLEQEYKAYMELIDYLINLIYTQDNPSPMTIMEGLKYIAEHRISPTQKLTIELDNILTEMTSVGFDYFTTNNPEKKSNLEKVMMELLQEMDEKCLEIELLLGIEQL